MYIALKKKQYENCEKVIFDEQKKNPVKLYKNVKKKLKNAVMLCS